MIKERRLSRGALCHPSAGPGRKWWKLGTWLVMEANISHMVIGGLWLPVDGELARVGARISLIATRAWRFIASDDIPYWNVKYQLDISQSLQDGQLLRARHTLTSAVTIFGRRSPHKLVSYAVGFSGSGEHTIASQRYGWDKLVCADSIWANRAAKDCGEICLRIPLIISLLVSDERPH